MDLLMKLEAIRKISSAGATASAMNDSTSFALNRAPITCWRRSNQSLTRFRKRRSTSSRGTIRCGWGSAKMVMGGGSGGSGAYTPMSRRFAAPTSRRKPAMITRLRLRRLSSLSSGILLDPLDRAVVGLARGLLRRARQPGEEGVFAVRRGLGADADVDHRRGVERGRGRQLEAAQFREDALGVAQLARGEDGPRLPVEGRDLEFLGDDVVTERPLDDLR